MSGWEHYLYSILACSLICGLVIQLVSDTKAKALVRIICTMAVALSIGNPLGDIDLHKTLDFSGQLWDVGDRYVREGTETARDAGAVCIQETCEAYILEKAKDLGAEISEVNIHLNEDLLPVYAEIHGRMDQAVQEILMRDLGIPKGAANMDMESGKQFIRFIKKYQYIFLVVLLGIFLMLLPGKPEQNQEPVRIREAVPPELEEELSRILSQIRGVGKAEVLLTEASGRDVIYQTDAAQNRSSLDTVIVRDADRQETGLVKQILPPVYKGALVVCQGGDSAAVRLQVVEAVKSVTGLASDCITVLKMK